MNWLHHSNAGIQNGAIHAESLGPHNLPPSLLHLAVPVLYACTGTCYFFAGHIVPVVAASVYYTLAFVHLLIFMGERTRDH